MRRVAGGLELGRNARPIARNPLKAADRVRGIVRRQRVVEHRHVDGQAPGLQRGAARPAELVAVESVQLDALGDERVKIGRHGRRVRRRPVIADVGPPEVIDQCIDDVRLQRRRRRGGRQRRRGGGEKVEPESHGGGIRKVSAAVV